MVDGLRLGRRTRSARLQSTSPAVSCVSRKARSSASLANSGAYLPGIGMDPPLPAALVRAEIARQGPILHHTLPVDTVAGSAGGPDDQADDLPRLHATRLSDRGELACTVSVPSPPATLAALGFRLGATPSPPSARLPEDRYRSVNAATSLLGS